MQKWMLIITFVILSSTSFLSFGATATTTFAVTATVSDICTISANPLGFGSTYNPTNAAVVNATTTILPTCTSGTSYNIGLDAGEGSGATVSARKMTKSGGATLNYSLYRDSGRTLNWGNTVGVDTYSGSGSGAQQSVTVYGQIPGSQTTVTTGSYSDLITATITY